MLTESEVAQYREAGYVVPQFRLPADRVARLREALERVIAANPDRRPEQLVSVHICGREPGEPNPEGVVGDEEFMAVCRDEAILGIVEQLIGPDIVLWGCQAFCKPPGDGMEVPWHQDGNYWPIRPLATCTLWVAIDDSLMENGCLRVIPGSHRSKSLTPHSREDRNDVVLNQQAVGVQVRSATCTPVACCPSSRMRHASPREVFPRRW